DALRVDELAPGDEGIDVREGDVLSRHGRLLVGRGLTLVGLFEIEGRVEVRVLVAEAGRVPELGQSHEPPRAQPDLFRELPPRGFFGQLALDVALAGRYLEELAAGRGTELTQQDRVV